MERQIEMERKKLEALAKQEEAKACAELEEKRIRHANRRAERQSAKQVCVCVCVCGGGGGLTSKVFNTDLILN